LLRFLQLLHSSHVTAAAVLGGRRASVFTFPSGRGAHQMVMPGEALVLCHIAVPVLFFLITFSALMFSSGVDHRVPQASAGSATGRVAGDTQCILLSCCMFRRLTYCRQSLSLRNTLHARPPLHHAPSCHLVLLRAAATLRLSHHRPTYLPCKVLVRTMFHCTSWDAQTCTCTR
jgi:hypothetical protein